MPRRICMTYLARLLVWPSTVLLVFVQTFHHFVNCALLTYAPFFVLEKGSTLYVTSCARARPQPGRPSSPYHTVASTTPACFGFIFLHCFTALWRGWARGWAWVLGAFCRVSVDVAQGNPPPLIAPPSRRSTESRFPSYAIIIAGYLFTQVVKVSG